MVNPGRSQREVYLHTWSSRVRGYAPRLLRLFTLVIIFVLFAPVQAAGRQNVELDWSNDAPLGGYQLGDFDGDGATDLFRVVGTQWQYSSGGTGPWTTLVNDAAPQNELRFGDFDGNGITDVFHKVGMQWRYRPNGSQPWVDLWMDTTGTPLTDLRFADFDGDHKTDVFSIEPGTNEWRYSPGGVGAWDYSLNMDPTPIENLRFGYFDNDDKVDIFTRRNDGRWMFSSGGVANWDDTTLNFATEVDLSNMALGDFDGDGITDVFAVINNSWFYSKSGIDGWVPLAGDPTPLSELRFGDFDGDNKTDVFSIGPGNQPRYSSGGASGWIPLNPQNPIPPQPPGPPVTDIGSLAFGDFNNDGITDVFRRTETGQWQYSPGGVGEWQNLNFDPLPLSQLRFGNFGGDARTDVFSIDGMGQWRWSDGGVGNWQVLATDNLTIDQVRFGFFSDPPNNITDVFSRDNNGQWRFREGGTGDWILLQSDPLPLVDLAFADFDGNGITDVFSIDPVTNRGRYSRDARHPWEYLDVQNIPLSLLRFGDFDGDGHDDIFTRTDSGQWRYLSAGRLPWIDVQSDPLSLNDLRFGDFNGDGFTDVFSIGPDGRWRYSSGAQSAWILLGPPGDPSPTPTFTPTPTPTGIPTIPSPTPEGCYDLLVNGDFESDSAWIFGDSPVPGKYTGAVKQNGLRAVQLGIPREVSMVQSYSSIRQLLMVPPATSTVTLRWWQWAGSEEGPNPNPSSFQDRFDIIALTPGGDTMRVIHRTRPVDGGWTSHMVDVTELAGKSFYLYFNLYNDGHGGRSWIYLDNMMLEVCPGSPPMHGGGPWGGPNKGGPQQGPWQKPGGQKPGGHNPWMPMTDTPTPTATMTPTPTATTPTTQADLELSKDVTQDMVEVGDEVTFTVVITNNGPMAATGVVVSDMLPDELIFGGSIASTGTYDDMTSFWTIGTLMPGDSATLQITATVGVGTSTVITNYAQVWASEQDDPDSTPGDNSATEDDDDMASIMVGPAADLSLNKSVLPSTASVGDDVTFTITVTNSGPDIANNVTVSDSLESGFDYLDHSSDLGSYDPGTGHWTIGTLNPAQSATLIITATILESEAGIYSNYAQVWTSDAIDPDSVPGNNSMTEDDDDSVVITVTGEIEIGGVNGQDLAVSPQAAPPSNPIECVELLTNGDFESGSGWNMSQGPATPSYTSDITFNGSGQAMVLGILEGDNLASISAIDQVVELPEDAHSIILSFRYYPIFEPSPGPGDLQYVDIYNMQTGQFAGRALGTQANDRTWRTADYDLTMQAGQRVRLVIAVNNDGVEGRSAMIVDNISIRACNFAGLVNPGGSSTPDPSLGASNIAVSDRSPILLAGREAEQSPSWLGRLSAMGVLASVAGVIAFAVMVVISTLRQP